MSTWVELATTGSTAVAAFAAAVAAGFSYRQTRVLNAQTQKAVDLAATTELRQLDVGLNAVLVHFLDRPQLHHYIFGQGDGSELDADERVRIDTLLDMYAAALDDGLSTTERHPETKSHEDWRKYARDTLKASPRLSDYVNTHPYFSELSALIEGKQPTADNPPPLPAPRQTGWRKALFGAHGGRLNSVPRQIVAADNAPPASPSTGG